MDKQNIVSKINVALEQVRPFLNDDGGDIELVDITKNMTVKVRFLGACKDCSINLSTLKSGVETAIKKELPEVKEVVAID